MSRMIWSAAIVLWLFPAFIFADPASATAASKRAFYPGPGGKYWDLHIVERDGGTPPGTVQLELTHRRRSSENVHRPGGSMSRSRFEERHVFLETHRDDYVNACYSGTNQIKTQSPTRIHHGDGDGVRWR